MTLPRSRLGTIAFVREVSTGLVQRPGRSALTALGTVLGMGTLVAVLGLTATAQNQVSDRFTVLAATGVTVEQVPGAGVEETGGPSLAFPEDAEERVAALNGVRSAGVWWSALDGETSVSASAPGTAVAGLDIAVYAAGPGAIRASRPRWRTGRGFDEFHERRAEPVAVLGATAAHQLGIVRLNDQPAVFIDGRPFTVLGIIASTERNKEFQASVLVPARTGLRLWGVPKEVDPRMTIETSLGAASLVARQAPLALRPDHPEYFRAIAPPDPRMLEEQVTGDLDVLFLILAAVSLLIGTFGIANTTLVAVLERVSEIGLRRAVGARPRHVAGQFLAESAALGGIGGLIGTALGIATILAVAVDRAWTPVMPGWLLGAPLLGAGAGLLAGLYPAWRATRVEPAEALRR